MKIEDQNAKTGYIKCKPVSPMIGKNTLRNAKTGRMGFIDNDMEGMPTSK